MAFLTFRQLYVDQPDGLLFGSVTDAPTTTPHMPKIETIALHDGVRAQQLRALAHAWVLVWGLEGGGEEKKTY